MNNATEAQAEAAIKALKVMIEAAENSNQDGENAVVKAAAASEMYEALKLLEQAESAESALDGSIYLESAYAAAKIALAKASGDVK